MASSSSNSQESNNRKELVSHYSNPSLVDHKYLSPANKKVVCDDMIYYCFDVLNSHLHKQFDHPPPKFANNEFPLFVTWYIGKEKRLRGCIGTFTPLNLHDGLKEYAITSAFRDSRFDPIGKDELSKLNCSVSLLTNFEPTNSWNDWVTRYSTDSNFKILYLIWGGTRKSASTEFVSSSTTRRDTDEAPRICPR